MLTETQAWGLLVIPEMNKWDRSAVDDLQATNDKVNWGLGQKWAQEIKKTGVFAFIFPGAQLSSTVVVCNSVPAENMYEGARFWSSFIYFEVPRW